MERMITETLQGNSVQKHNIYLGLEKIRTKTSTGHNQQIYWNGAVHDNEQYMLDQNETAEVEK